MTRELHDFSWWQLEDLFELATNVHQDLLSLLRRSTLAARHITISSTGNTLANSASPDTDTEEALANIDHDAHDFTVFFLLEGLADGGEHDMEPELIDGDIALLLELV
jgi:hypothetical protein